MSNNVPTLTKIQGLTTSFEHFNGHNSGLIPFENMASHTCYRCV